MEIEERLEWIIVGWGKVKFDEEDSEDWLENEDGEWDLSRVYPWHGVCCTRGEHCAGYGANQLIFGSGTRLRIEPKRDEDLNPSVYVLRAPAAVSSDDRQALAPAACLATDYFPNKYNLTLTMGDASRTSSSQSAQVSTTDRSYSLLSFIGGSTPQSEINCELNPGALDDGKSDDGKLSCIPVEETDEDGEYMRGVSLTVFGMRMLFFKGVIFNILMSVRVWTS